MGAESGSPGQSPGSASAQTAILPPKDWEPDIEAIRAHFDGRTTKPPPEPANAAREASTPVSGASVVASEEQHRIRQARLAKAAAAAHEESAYGDIPPDTAKWQREVRERKAREREEFERRDREAHYDRYLQDKGELDEDLQEDDELYDKWLNGEEPFNADDYDPATPEGQRPADTELTPIDSVVARIGGFGVWENGRPRMGALRDLVPRMTAKSLEVSFPQELAAVRYPPVSTWRVVDRTQPKPEPLLSPSPLAIYRDPSAPTVVGGAAKAGKSQAVVAMLSAHPDKRVWYLAAEGTDWIDYLITKRHPNPGNCRVGTVPNDSALSDIREWPADIVVIDPVTLFAAALGLDTNSDVTPGQILGHVQRYTGAVSTIMVAHHRKEPGGNDLDRIRGTGALGGLAGLVWEVTLPKDSSTTRVRAIAYRNGPPPQGWHLDLGSGDWTTGSPDSSQEEVRDAICDALHKAGKATSVRDLRNALERRHRKRINSEVLHEMCAEKMVLPARLPSGYSGWICPCC